MNSFIYKKNDKVSENNVFVIDGLNLCDVSYCDINNAKTNHNNMFYDTISAQLADVDMKLNDYSNCDTDITLIDEGNNKIWGLHVSYDNDDWSCDIIKYA